MWSAFLVLPLFALANAGIPISGSALAEAAGSAVALGVAAGLVLGKPLGIASFAWGGVRAGLARFPPGVGVRHMIGLGLVAGVGFTVSIFIAGLALSEERVNTAKLGILAASAVAGTAGYLLLRAVSPEGPDDGETAKAGTEEARARPPRAS